MKKGIGPQGLGASKSPAKMYGAKSPAKQAVSVKPSEMEGRGSKNKESEASAYMDELKEKRAKKAEQHGDAGRAQRIRSTKGTQSNVG